MFFLDRTIEFARPHEAFWFGCLLLVFFLFFLVRRKKKRIVSLVMSLAAFKFDSSAYGKNLLVSWGVALIAVVGLVLSLMQPQWGMELKETTQRGTDIFILMDTSMSMLAQDVSPNRLERAKREIKDLLGLLQGDRLGLIPFAGTSYVACPLTHDADTLALFVDQLDTEFIPVQGTNLLGALTLANQSFDQGEAHYKAIFLISDGELTQGGVDDAIEFSQKNKIKIFAMGVGKKEGAPIPLGDQSAGFKKDDRGELILSKLTEDDMQKLAVETGGLYVRSVSSDDDLKKIYLEGIRSVMDAQDLKSRQKMIPIERYMFPLALAFVVLLFEVVYLSRRQQSL